MKRGVYNIINKYTLLILVLTIFFILPVSAYDRITQGDKVYIGETVDISGVTGWSDTLVYWGGEFSSIDEPMYKLTLPPKMRLGNGSSQYRFYIDPKIFGDRIGNWYAWYGTEESHGNNIAFKVAYGERKIDNDTILNITVDRKQEEQFIPPPVPTKEVARYLVARGDNLTIDVSYPSRLYIFGDKDGIYNLRSINNSVYINESLIQNLRVGEYTLLIQQTGNDNEFNVIYDNKKKILHSLYSSTDNFETNDIDLTSYSPPLFLSKLKDEITKTNDYYNTYTLAIQDPSLDIISRDDLDVNKIKLLQLKGYTNTAKGTKLCFGIDEEIQNKSLDYKPTCTFAEGDEIGNMRYFIVSVPFSYNDLSVGEHFITGNTEIGGSQTVSFNVYSTWDSTPRNVTTKYIAGNEFKPTPTPEIIRVVETQIVRVIETQIVVEQLTPDLKQLYETTKKSQDTIILQIGGGLLFLIIIGYIISIVMRGRRD
jgi:hypothetical protein